MNKLYLITLLLTSCAITKPDVIHVPVTPPLPMAPSALLTPCESLPEFNKDDMQVKNLIKKVVQIQGMYKICSNKVTGWQEFYREVSK